MVFILGFSSLMAQTFSSDPNLKSKVVRKYDEAVLEARYMNYASSLALLDGLLKDIPDFVDALLLKAAIKYDQKKYPDSRGLYAKALSLAPDYSPEAYYQYGTVLMMECDYILAQAMFEQLLELYKVQDPLSRMTTIKLDQVKFINAQMADPVSFAPERLSTAINTEESEYLPLFSADGQTMIYTARRNRQEDLYMSKLINGAWSPGQPIPDINTPENEGAQSISADGRTLVFTACNRPGVIGGCDLFISYYKGSKWSKPQNMGPNVNSRWWESQPALSADGRSMLFASERRGGLGKRDIWITYHTGDFQWVRPINLGPSINTKKNDQAPFYHPDGQTLYFMSQGHENMGGYDLFVSRWNGNAWGEPVNLGYPINTPANEGALFIDLEGQYGYFASDKPIGEWTSCVPPSRGQNDIYRFPIPASIKPQPVSYLKGVVLDQVTKSPLGADIELFDLESGQIYTQIQTDPSDGGFLVCLPAGKTFALEVESDSYLFHSEHFDLKEVTSFTDPFQKVIELIPIPKDDVPTRSKPVVLNNVFFACSCKICI